MLTAALWLGIQFVAEGLVWATAADSAVQLFPLKSSCRVRILLKTYLGGESAFLSQL